MKVSTYEQYISVCMYACMYLCVCNIILYVGYRMYSNSFLITTREHIKCLQGANISDRQTAKVCTAFDVRRHYIIIIYTSSV